MTSGEIIFQSMFLLSSDASLIDLMTLENLFEFEFIPSYCGLKPSQLPVPVNLLIVMPD